MNTEILHRLKNPLRILSLGILIWALFGVLDVRNQAYSGYATDGNNTITQVVDGSPADEAGLVTGDYIRSVGGIAIEDTRAIADQGRPEINEVRTIEVEREGQAVSVEMRYTAPPLNIALVSYGVVFIGFLFLIFGVWAFFAVQTSSTLLLVVLGFAFSIPLTAGPYFASPSLRTAVGVILLLLITVGFAVLTHFLLLFPQRKRALERRNATWMIYGPAAVVALLAIWQLVAQPAATSAVNVFLRVLFGLFLVAYFGTALIALIHSFLKTSPHDRAENGLNLLLLGAAVGLGPSLVISIVGLIAPRVVVPGAQFLPLGIGVLPVTFAIAAVKRQRKTQVA